MSKLNFVGVVTLFGLGFAVAKSLSEKDTEIRKEEETDADGKTKKSFHFSRKSSRPVKVSVLAVSTSTALTQTAVPPVAAPSPTTSHTQHTSSSKSEDIRLKADIRINERYGFFINWVEGLPNFWKWLIYLFVAAVLAFLLWLIGDSIISWRNSKPANEAAPVTVVDQRPETATLPVDSTDRKRMTLAEVVQHGAEIHSLYNISGARAYEGVVDPQKFFKAINTPHVAKRDTNGRITSATVFYERPVFVGNTTKVQELLFEILYKANGVGVVRYENLLTGEGDIVGYFTWANVQ